MIYHTKLRGLAEACKRIDALHDKPITWFSEIDLLVNFEFHEDDCAYIAASSPDVVLGLLEQLDLERKMLDIQTTAVQQLQTQLDVMRVALADADIERDADREAMQGAFNALCGADMIDVDMAKAIDALRARLEK